MLKEILLVFQLDVSLNLKRHFAIVIVVVFGMASAMPSRTWSCQTLKCGLGLSDSLPMTLDGLGEMSVEAMEQELAQLKAGTLIMIVLCWVILVVMDFSHKYITTVSGTLPCLFLQGRRSCGKPDLRGGKFGSGGCEISQASHTQSTRERA